MTIARAKAKKQAQQKNTETSDTQDTEKDPQSESTAVDPKKATRCADHCTC
ncbi:hypothetical protein ACLKMH_08585 [Psychromonas sp. KJ10-10]|uniref:hypothetical protein n=1 Tax=Psychromonas sp. KJ10-10 TaxID=3391823 RepID=UPI0039B537B8